MKRRMQSIVFLLLCIVSFSFAQVTEESKEMLTGTNNALVVEIAETNKKVAEDVWKSMLKKYRGKTKKKRKQKQWTTSKFRMSSVTGQESGIIYSQLEEVEDEENVVQLSLWVPGEEEYVSSTSDPEAYAAAEKLLEDYALEVRIATVEQEFKSKNRILEAHKKDLKKLKKDNDDYHKAIKNSKKTIKDSEKGLEKNEENQDLTEDRLDNVKAVFEVANDTLQTMRRDATDKDEEKSIKKMIKKEEDKVKDVEKDLKKLNKEEKKLYKAIEDSKDKIHQAEEDIVKNEKDQERKEEEIAEHQEIVDEVEARLKQLKSYRK